MHEFNKILKKEKLASEVYSVGEIVSAMKENFSYCWYQFNKFWFIYIKRWRKELKDLEVFAIGMVVLINTIKNPKFIILIPAVREIFFHRRYYFIN